MNIIDKYSKNDANEKKGSIKMLPFAILLYQYGLFILKNHIMRTTLNN